MLEVSRNDIAAVVVLYRPSRQDLDNVAAYVGQVSRVFAIDNTEHPDPAFVSLLATFPNLEYVSLGDNMGIAAALNAGAERALVAGCSWLLTMDQDSAPPPDMIEDMLACLSSLPDQARVGIVTPAHQEVAAQQLEAATGCVDVLTAMTSGNLLSLAAFRDVGPFMEGLFIDSVDVEYCLRLHQAGYRVVLARSAVLSHRVGAARRRRWPVPALASDHTPVRHYYMMRNRLVVARMYRAAEPEYYRFEAWRLVRDVVKTLLYESSRLEKCRMMWRGYRDYQNGRMGRFEP